MGILDFFSTTKKERRICVVGLDNAGKSTIVHRLGQLRQAGGLAPTVGFAVHECRVKGINFTVFDMAGAGRYRSLWEQYYSDVQAPVNEWAAFASARAIGV